MQVLAIGKWSKTLKRFQTVISIRRPTNDPPPRRSPNRPTTRAKDAS